MIKRKRKLNKQALINVRRYTIVGNTTKLVGHFFNIGESVKSIGNSDETCGKYVNSEGLEQWVSTCDVI